MGIIAMILLLAIGVGAAWVIDTFVFQKNRKSIDLEGPVLTQILKRSHTYEAIRSGKEIPSLRSRHRDLYHRDRLVEPGDGGNGGEVLRLDPRRKV